MEYGGIRPYSTEYGRYILACVARAVSPWMSDSSDSGTRPTSEEDLKRCEGVMGWRLVGRCTPRAAGGVAQMRRVESATAIADSGREL